MLLSDKAKVEHVATCLDLYLQGLGVPRRVVETLAGFRFCHSYKSGLGTMKSPAEHAQVGISLKILIRPDFLLCVN